MSVMVSSQLVIFQVDFLASAACLVLFFNTFALVLLLLSFVGCIVIYLVFIPVRIRGAHDFTAQYQVSLVLSVKLSFLCQPDENEIDFLCIRHCVLIFNFISCCQICLDILHGKSVSKMCFLLHFNQAVTFSLRTRLKKNVVYKLHTFIIK